MPLLRPRRPSSLALAPAALLLLAAAPLAAQSGARAENAPILLRLPAGTRALALGNAGVAVADPDAVHYNPAQLATGRGIIFGLQGYGGEGVQGSYAHALAAGAGGLGIGVQYLDFAQPCAACVGDVPGSAADLTRDGPLRASALAATVGYARQLFGVRVGVAGKYVEQRAGGTRDGLLAADVGVGYALGAISVGLAVQNLGPSMRLPGGVYDLPRRISAGAAFSGLPFGPIDLSASAAIAHVADADDGDLVAGGGVEVAWSWLDGHSVAGRVGLKSKTEQGDSPLTLGAAFTRDRITIEYAFQPLEQVDDSHRIGLRLRLP